MTVASLATTTHLAPVDRADAGDDPRARARRRRRAPRRPAATARGTARRGRSSRSTRSRGRSLPRATWRSRALRAAARAHALEARARGRRSARGGRRGDSCASRPTQRLAQRHAVARLQSADPSTVPAVGAVIASSIFIDSRTSSTSPASTRSPSCDVRRAGPSRASGPRARRRRRAGAARRGARCAPRGGGRRGRSRRPSSPSTRDGVAARRCRRGSPARRPSPRSRIAAVHVRSAAVTRPPAIRTSPCSKRRRQGPGGVGGARAAASAAAGRRSCGGAGTPPARQDALDQPGVQLAGADVVAGQQRAQEGGVRRHAEQLEAGQRAVEAAQRGGAVLRRGR